MTKKMTRVRVKGTKFKATSLPDQEPNFYTMTCVEASALNPVNTKKHRDITSVVSASEDGFSKSTPDSPSVISEDCAEEKTHAHPGSRKTPSPPQQPKPSVVAVPSFGVLTSNDGHILPKTLVPPTPLMLGYISSSPDADTKQGCVSDALSPIRSFPHHPTSPPMVLNVYEERASNLWNTLSAFNITPSYPNLRKKSIDLQAATTSPTHFPRNLHPTISDKNNIACMVQHVSTLTPAQTFDVSMSTNHLKPNYNGSHRAHITSDQASNLTQVPTISVYSLSCFPVAPTTETQICHLLAPSCHEDPIFDSILDDIFEDTVPPLCHSKAKHRTAVSAHGTSNGLIGAVPDCVPVHDRNETAAFTVHESAFNEKDMEIEKFVCGISDIKVDSDLRSLLLELAES